MRASANIRVLIVARHPVVLLGLQDAISRQPDLVVVGAVQRVEVALKLVRGTTPQVIVLDLCRSGMAPEVAVAQFRDAQPSASILLLAAEAPGNELCRSLDAGAAGVVFRTAELEEVAEAIRIIRTGALWLPTSVVERFAAHIQDARLTPEEVACLRLLATSHDCRQIASALGRSERQVSRQMRRLRTKLGARNEAHMLATALRLGIVTLD